MTRPTDATLQAVILAAGKGTRMRSETIKVLHPLLGDPLIDHVIDAAREAGCERVTLVVGHDRERVTEHVSQREDHDALSIAVQDAQLGTGHAVWCAREQLGGDHAASHTLILYGDVPNLSAESLQTFVDDALSSPDQPLAVMTAVLDDAGRYGRMIRDHKDQITGIVEHSDASPEQRQIKEINSGIYLVQTRFLLDELERLCTGPVENAQGEFYLTDLVATASQKGGARGWIIEDDREIQGVNTRQDLASAEAIARDRLNTHWMLQGVTMLDPSTTYIGRRVQLAADTTLYPNVHLSGRTSIGAHTTIEPGCVIRDTEIGAHCLIKSSCYTDEARVEDGAHIGPFAHLRPGADIGPECKIGNFVEIKKTRMERGSKASHLTYLGDAHVGAKANVGAGTITCNYDGANKHRTEIGEGAFIGSNTALVAPVTVGQGAYVGAGSTITTSIPDGALGVARSRQRNIEGWAARAAPRKRDDPSS